MSLEQQLKTLGFRDALKPGILVYRGLRISLRCVIDSQLSSMIHNDDSTFKVIDCRISLRSLKKIVFLDRGYN